MYLQLIGKTLEQQTVNLGIRSQTPDTGKVKESIPKEGGNIFKVDGVPVTQRIKKDDIDLHLIG